MNDEVEKNILQKLTEFEKNLLQIMARFEERMDKLEQRMDKLEQKMDKIEKDVKVLKQDVSVLKVEVFDNIKPSLKSLEYKLDTITNENISKILNEQTRHNKKCEKEHEDIKKQAEMHETENQLEHKRLDYEIYKLKVNA